jgi:hypothetical protein
MNGQMSREAHLCPTGFGSFFAYRTMEITTKPIITYKEFSLQGFTASCRTCLAFHPRCCSCGSRAITISLFIVQSILSTASL